tara:strand:- start:1550 stop:1759 length:210 start_codon:yes stop_codon:yes gene_type:complete
MSDTQMSKEDRFKELAKASSDLDLIDLYVKVFKEELPTLWGEFPYRDVVTAIETGKRIDNPYLGEKVDF